MLESVKPGAWECLYEGVAGTYRVLLAPGCNCVILASQRPSGGFGSFGSVDDNAVYAKLVEQGKLIDVRPFLPFRNPSGTGGSEWEAFKARVIAGPVPQGEEAGGTD